MLLPLAHASSSVELFVIYRCQIIHSAAVHFMLSACLKCSTFVSQFFSHIHHSISSISTIILLVFTRKIILKSDVPPYYLQKNYIADNRVNLLLATGAPATIALMAVHVMRVLKSAIIAGLSTSTMLNLSFIFSFSHC